MRRRLGLALPFVLLAAATRPEGLTMLYAAFVGSTTSTGSFATDTLNPPSGFNATRACAPIYTAPTYISASSDRGGAYDVLNLFRYTLTPNKPTGVGSGDLLLAFVHTTDSGVTPTGPAGWTKLDQEQFNVFLGPHATAQAWYKVAGGSEPASYTFSNFGSAHDASVVVVAYNNPDSPPIDVHLSDYGTSGNGVAPSVTSTGAPATLVTGIMTADTSPGTPAGMTLRKLETSMSSAGNAVYDQALAAAGATGTRTSATSSGAWVGFTVVLSPLVTGYDPTVDLAWTATPDTYASGYTLTRSPGSSTSISGRTTVTATDSTTTSSTGYTYTLATVYGSWTSTTVSDSVLAC